MSLRSRLLAPLTCAVVVGLFGLAPSPAQADPAPVDRPRKEQTKTVFARSSYLCIGYQGCRAAGMPHRGYAQANTKMYWRMYAGHNCTNYAAYRMVRSGLPNERPWSGGGNATYWGTSMPKITDGTPRVGAVAWWRANTGPAGSAGHVAYVERVVSADEIVISQDSWGGDFSWAVVTRNSGNWPSGFIHFNDVPLLNKTAPAISGLAKVGSVLSATAGAWKPGGVTVSYQWRADGQPLTGATKPTLRLAKGHLGRTITVTTTATKPGYPTKTAASAPTPAVLPGQLKNTAAPKIAGEPQVDQTLTLSTGTWTPEPSLRLQWLADGRPIDGATGTQLRLTPELVDKTISATVTASRSGYDPVSATTAPTAPVAPGIITITRQPSISGTARWGQTLTVDPGASRPYKEVTAAFQWLRDGAPVLNATGPTYRLTAEDLGHRMSVQVTLSRLGYRDSTATAPATGRVRSTPKLTFQREILKHRVRVTLNVSAPGVSPVTGTVVVRVQGGFRQEVSLRNGSAKVSITGLPKGKRTIRLVYLGSSTVERGNRTGTIRMP